MHATAQAVTDGSDAAFLAAARRHVRYTLGKELAEAKPHDLFVALAHALRERLVDALFETERRRRESDAKSVYYLSVEFLIGSSLESTLQNLGLLEAAHAFTGEVGVPFERVIESEPDAALGNGGLGRLAACFLESLATLDMPGYGYGINYEHGLFRQTLEGGQQHERPDSWRRLGSPWLLPRPDRSVLVPVYGRAGAPVNGASEWRDASVIIGVPHDLPIAGEGGRTVNWLRLFSARASDEFDIEIFNSGDYVRAFEQKLAMERISKVLYPASASEAGLELRLLQEYFFAACALRDILRRHLEEGHSLDALPDKVAVQMNDTHPALAVAELMRLLIDQHALPFERAFELTRGCLAYTNHTLLPEALETWPRPMLESVVPRHLQIIEELNARFLDQVVARWPGDLDRMRRMSMIDEGTPKRVRMAQLAVIGSHAVNGVSQLHAELVRTRLLPDFAELWPERFHGITNGVTPRRWLRKANPGLARLVSERIGDAWIRDLEALRALEPAADESGFRAAFAAVKRANKERLSRHVAGRALDPDALFDVQIKRMHEYKRQLLAALHALHLYLALEEDGASLAGPRTCVFAGKAAPDYFTAKLVIRLLVRLAEVIEASPRVRGQLRVLMLPDYRVSLAERIIPAADLSEQISTAGMEASGTGNMKLSLNGALTIGTLDGANIEIREAVGAENVYVFGLEADAIEALRRDGYDARARVAASPALARVLDALGNGRLSPDEPGLFRPLVDGLLDGGDPFFVTADFDAYVETQARAARDFLDRDAWLRRAVLTVSRIGRFSSDRAVREYAERIWAVRPLA